MMLEEFGCETDFIPLKEGNSRINVKINAGTETEINGQGPVITEEAIQALYEKLDKLEEGDVLILAGSIPNTLPEDIYERILERLSGKEIRFVVDASTLYMNPISSEESFCEMVSSQGFHCFLSDQCQRCFF